MSKHSPTSTNLHATGMAVLAFEIDLGDGLVAPARLRVLPDGEFSAPDGRPANMDGVTAKSWLMNEQAAKRVMARFAARGLDLPLDYEHQTLHSKDNGLPAPASGWITALSYEPGDGLWADVRWTDAGGSYVAKKEYRYLSPVFPFDKDTGEVLDLHSVALTNKPGLTGLGAIAALAQDYFSLCRLPGSGRTTDDEEPTMDKTQVLVALGLPLDTGDTTALTALTALSAKSATLEAQVAALKATQFDPAQHIPLAEHKKVTDAMAALQATQEQAEHTALITAALADARILPANEAYWRKQPVAALKEFLKDAKPMAALTTMQTGGQPPAGAAGGATVALSAEELSVCHAMGQTPEDFAKARS